MEATMDAIMTSAGREARTGQTSWRGAAEAPSRGTAKCTVLRIGGAASSPGICSSYASPRFDLSTALSLPLHHPRVPHGHCPPPQPQSMR